MASPKHLDEADSRASYRSKISSSSRRSRKRRSRMVLLEPQTTEQLAEVPTVVPVSSLQQIAEEIVDIPVPRRRRGALVEVFKVYSQDKFHHSVLWSRSLNFQFVVEVHKQGSHPGQSSTAFTEQNVDIPAPRGDPQDFH